jgi:hypothetical protein
VPDSTQCACHSMHAPLLELLELTGRYVSSTCQFSIVANAACQGQLQSETVAQRCRRSKVKTVLLACCVVAVPLQG